MEQLLQASRDWLEANANWLGPLDSLTAILLLLGTVVVAMLLWIFKGRNTASVHPRSVTAKRGSVATGGDISGSTITITKKTSQSSPSEQDDAR